MIVTPGKHRYYMDGYLHSACERMKIALSRKWDLCIVVDGPEGVGKSELGMQVAAYLDPTISLDRICFTGEEMEEAIKNAKKGQAVILDEAMQALYSRQAMSKGNISLTKIFAECRQKELILIIILPAYFALDSYVALHRSRALIHCYSRNLQRGFFCFYNATKKKEMYILGKAKYQYCVPPNFRGRFYKYVPVNEEEYKAKKWEALTKKKAIDKKEEMRLCLLRILKAEKWSGQKIADRINEMAGAKITSRNRICEWLR